MSKCLTSPKWEKFAQEYARFGNITRAYVAAGYSERGADRSGHRLLRNAEVCRRVKELQQILADGVIKLEISDRNARIQAYQDRRDRMRALMDARAQDPAMATAAGGKTGLLVRTVKMIGSGPNAYEVEEFGFDAALQREMRELEKQAAIESGQWVEKQDVSTQVDVAAILTAITHGRQRAEAVHRELESGAPAQIEGRR